MENFGRIASLERGTVSDDAEGTVPTTAADKASIHRSATANPA